MTNALQSLRPSRWRYLPLIIVALIFIFPLEFMIMSSFKPAQQLLSDTNSFRAFLPVGELSFDNYFAAFKRAPVALFVMNSVIITGITVLLSLLFSSMAAFSFVFLEWRGRNTILTVLLTTLIIPIEIIAVPLLLLVNKLPWIGLNGFTIGWLNSYHVQIIPFAADALSVYLFVQYFKDLPRELVEAARMEGATWWQIYYKVIVPLSGPVMATAAILKFLAMYNQFMWPLMTVQAEQYRPVMVGLQYFFQLNIAWGEVMAYRTLITVPVLAFYLLLQRAFIASIASTGIKE